MTGSDETTGNDEIDKRLQEYEQLTLIIARHADEDLRAALDTISSLILEFRQASIESPSSAPILVNMTSVLINIANDLHDEPALAYALEVLDELMSGTPAGKWITHAAYNRANTRDDLVQLKAMRAYEAADEAEAMSAYLKARLQVRATLRLARRDFLASAEDPQSGHQTQARTNLGNMLSTSGRWLEAFEEYAEAVHLDSTNGNAAGNAALSLYRAIQAGLGPTGHLAAVYAEYRAIAQANRSRTVELAGEAAALRWDELPEIPTRGHLAHANSDKPYAQWVAQERLALTAVMHGLGSDNARFDDASIESVISYRDKEGMPEVFAAANVLKGDYLAARRTVYQGLQMLEEGDQGRRLHPSDTGTYADTLDYAVYGESVSLVTLGARAALDVLDKIAVATNQYLDTGDDAGAVTYRKYWFEKGSKVAPWRGLHAKFLGEPDQVIGRLVALAELADDLEEGGLYEDGQAVRNRSTHRLVRAKLFDAEGITNTALTTLDVDVLGAASIQSLRVARAAILYFHALVGTRERAKARKGEGVVLPLVVPDFE
ncbi:LA2681 family HEPN domain-containing protein [uncultured Modestobacter sp.]|uniref:LA2681 family HEPN domain-containing protein n=1 Tax=uncultured Modestobacter sp. TaxID=380048 RepID=UPI002601E81B|nr:LA2681 family HEPN domain-containing protein [uncultured Modestobacter sp.]